jgi:DNA repair protein RecO (recombination protein O)
MPTRRDEAFVLARYPFRERDLVVALLTRGSGQVRMVARRARTLRSSQATSMEPLALINVTYYERPGAELATLHEASVVRSGFPLAADPPAWAAGQVVAELALLYCQPGQRAEAAFRLVDRCLACLLERHEPESVAWYAELWFLKLAGVFPELDRCGVCGADLPEGPRVFDPAEKRFTCQEHRPAHSAVRISAAGSRWLKLASRLPLEQVTGPAPEEVGGWLVTLREQFTERQLKSWRYLRLLLKEEGRGERGEQKTREDRGGKSRE